MFKVYVLKDEEGKLYKGFTSDINQRLKDHRRGKTKTTSKMGSLTVIYTEQYATLREAREREKYFKSAAGRRFLKRTIKMHA